MSAMDVNKLAGAIIMTLLFVMVIGMIGNTLVQPRQHAATVTADAGKPKAAPKAAPVLEKVAPLLASANVGKGQKIFKKCAACHTSAKGGAKKIGPNLWNVVNAKRAQVAGFAYSKAMKGKEGNWNYADLNAFLAKPKAFIKGTKMAFAGIKKVKDRADLIAFLRSLSESPAALP